MLLPPIKRRVRESFDRAALTYDAAAVVQRRVCDRLAEELGRLVLSANREAPLEKTPPRVLDAGCGTGYGARILRDRWKNALITGVDFAPAMLDLARRGIDACLAADIEKLPFDDAQFDLWWSSLAIQWCDASTVFKEAARVVTPGGLIALSTLGPGTFCELREAFANVDRHRHTLPFSEYEGIEAALRGAGLEEIVLHRETHTVFYPDLKALLRAVKDIGAHNVGEGGRSGMMGRCAWQALEAAYESYRGTAGLPASYDVILAFARKRTT